MRRRFFNVVCFVIILTAITQQICLADIGAFTQHYDSAQAYLSQGQYSSAIVEFRKALRINYLDNSAQIGLINSYLARAAYYANQDKNYEKAANDFRSALFYLKIYPEKAQSIANSAGLIATATENLNQCLKVISYDTTSSARYKKAEELKAMGNFSASAYEFYMASKNESRTSEAYIQIADLLKLLGNEPRSANYYKMALDLNSQNNLLRMKYARTLDKLGRYDEALEQYNIVMTNSKGDLEVLYALERIYLKKLAETPSDAELNANLGAIKQAQGDLETALSYYAKAEQINPSNVNTRLNIGTLFQQKHDYLKAIKSYDSVLTLYPDNIQANLYKAQALAASGDSKGAINFYKKVLSLDSANSTAKTEMVNVMQATMSPDEFISYMNQNANNQSMQNILYDYAYKLHKDNKTEYAITAYKAVLSNNPNNTDAYINLAICYASINDYKNATNVINTAKTKFPNNSLVLKTLKDIKSDSITTVISAASENYENKDYKKALSQYLSINPETEDSLLGVAACYQAMENPQKAIEYYKKAEIISPNNSDIPYYIGYLYSEQEKWLEAEGYLRKAIKINQNSEAQKLLAYVVQNGVNVNLNAGITLFEKNDYASALSKFNSVLNKDANNAYAYYYRALIYDEQKKTELAINDYKNTIKHTQEIPLANYMLAVDYDSLGKYKEACTYYNTFIAKYSTDDEYLKYAKSRVQELKPYVK